MGREDQEYLVPPPGELGPMTGCISIARTYSGRYAGAYIGAQLNNVGGAIASLVRGAPLGGIGMPTTGLEEMHSIGSVPTV